MSLKSGTSMGYIIDTRKSKKYKKMRICNCSQCVNNQKKGCRFGWVPINGMCNRFGTNHYELNEEETKEAIAQSIANKEALQKEEKARNEIHITTIDKIQSSLETILSYDQVKSATNDKYFGNGRFALKCIDWTEEYLIISITFRNKKIRKYKIFKKIQQ